MSARLSVSRPKGRTVILDADDLTDAAAAVRTYARALGPTAVARQWRDLADRLEPVEAHLDKYPGSMTVEVIR